MDGGQLKDPFLEQFSGWMRAGLAKFGEHLERGVFLGLGVRGDDGPGDFEGSWGRARGVAQDGHVGGLRGVCGWGEWVFRARGKAEFPRHGEVVEVCYACELPEGGGGGEKARLGADDGDVVQGGLHC